MLYNLDGSHGMSNDASITARQIWGQLATSAASQTVSEAWCTPLILPSGGLQEFSCLHKKAC